MEGAHYRYCGANILILGSLVTYMVLVQYYCTDIYIGTSPNTPLDTVISIPSMCYLLHSTSKEFRGFGLIFSVLMAIGMQAHHQCTSKACKTLSYRGVTET